MILAGLHPFTQSSWLEWSIHPSTVTGLAVLAGPYVWRASRAKGNVRLGSAKKLSFVSALPK
jgi:hypothetical protein